jgi:hypothetical protein
LKLVDRVYWLVRAEDHLDLARRAEDERAAHAHAYLAAFYLDRVHRGEMEDFGDEELRAPEAGSQPASTRLISA